ncbi:S1C family serine protease [Singulisphaera rosea]
MSRTTPPLLLLATLTLGMVLGVLIDRRAPFVSAQATRGARTEPVGNPTVVAVSREPQTKPNSEAELYQRLDRQYNQFEHINRTFEMVAEVVSPAVVHIVSHKVERSSEPPYNRHYEETGSGVIVRPEHGRQLYVLTNNHVVEKAKPEKINIFLRDGRSIQPDGIWLDAKADIAVLSLGRDDLPAARLGDSDSTAVGSWVLALGSPFGLTHSVSQGIISARGRHVDELHDVENQDFLQTDAAINPGNSGGPALVNDKLIGLIFSRLNQSDNIGYIIPSEEIDLFLKDVADGKYDGKPAMHDVLQTLENDALRGKLGLDKKVTGMVVHGPDSDDESYPLKEWDLVTKIGDHEIDNVGLVKIRDNLRLRFQYLIQKLAKDGKVTLSLIRQGKPMTVELPVSPKHTMLIESLRGQYPPYFVYGPLVFSPVTTEFLSGFERAGERFYNIFSMIGSPIVTRRGDKPKFEGEELVVVSAPMFPHLISKGYSNPFTKVVKDVNGTPVRNMRHFVELLRDANDKYITISFNDRASETIVFDRKEVLRATDDILNDNGVRQQASEELLSVWSKSK